MKKNILCFYNSTCNSISLMSGGDQVFIQIFKRIGSQFENFWCVTSFTGEYILKQHLSNINYVVAPKIFDRVGLMGGYVLRTFYALKALLFRPDIVFSASDYFPDVIPAYIMKIFFPKIFWVQCIFHVYPSWRTRSGSFLRNIVGQYLQQFSFYLSKRADLVMSINQDVRSHLITIGVSPERIIVNPPGINSEDIDKIPSSQNSSHKYDGVFLGRLNFNKGAMDLIEIWHQLVKLQPKARLGIIGGGSDEIVTDLKNRIRVLRLENNIDLLGFLENQQAFAILKASKTFVFPSREEGFGIAIVEAMQCGLPVISWDLPVFLEHFSGAVETIKRYDYDLFALRVLKFSDELEPRQLQISRGKDCAAKFSWSSAANYLFSQMAGGGQA